jgi:MerR family copper efflux transcriptional regulator
METLTIGKLAERAGVNLETVRYYEREGLMPPPPRKLSGHRAYPSRAVTRLRFIKRAKNLGFSLAEIKDLLDLRRDPNHPCLDVVQQIDSKAAQIEERIAHLKAIRRALLRMKHSCNGACPVSECPILESLEHP